MSDFNSFQAARLAEREQARREGIRHRHCKIIGAPADAPMGYLVWRGQTRAYYRQLPGGEWEVGRWVKRELQPLPVTATSTHEAFGMAVGLVLAGA